MRAAVGPDIDLMIEVHGRLNVPTAIAMARALAKFEPRWFEEPVPPESIDALADVRAGSPIPIATGERYFEPERFMELIHKRAVDILQPDVGHVGGMLEAQKIAAMGACALPARGAAQPDRPGDERDDAAARRDDPEFLHPGDDRGRRAVAPGDRARSHSRFTNSEITIPDLPGLGLELDEEACARHPYVRHPIRQFDADRGSNRPDGAVPFVTAKPG